MLTPLVLLAVSTLQPGASLAEHAPRGVYLLEHGALAQADRAAPPPPAMPSVAVTPESLRLEMAALEESMPSIAPGVTLIVVGSLGILGGVFAGFIGLVLAALQAGAGVLIAGLVALGIGVPVLIVGIVLLSRATRERGEINHDLGALERQLRALEAPGPSLPSSTPPPQVRGPAATLLLASF